MLGSSVGLSAEEMSAMADAATSPLFDDTDRLVIRYSETSTRSIQIDDELYAALARRFPKDELLELCFTVALAALVNRVHATFQTDLDETTRLAVGEGLACPIGR